MDVCNIHKMVACAMCARAALARMTERCTPVFRNGIVAGSVADLKAGKLTKGAVKK